MIEPVQPFDNKRVHGSFDCGHVAAAMEHDESSSRKRFKGSLKNGLRKWREEECHCLLLSDPFVRTRGLFYANNSPCPCADLDPTLCHRVLNLDATDYCPFSSF